MTGYCINPEKCEKLIFFVPVIWQYSSPMKKAMFGLMILSAISSASAANYMGGFVGNDAGVHFQQSLTRATSMRYALTALSIFSNKVTIGGEVAYLNNMPTRRSRVGLTPYYGAGMGLGMRTISSGNNSVTGIGLYPHGLLGVKMGVANAFSVFAEGNVGLQMNVIEDSTEAGLGAGVRVGVNIRLP